MPLSPLTLIMLLLVFLLVRGDSPGSSQAETCSTADLVLAEGDVIVRFIEGGPEMQRLTGTVFVRRETLFDGVSLWVQGNHGEIGAWFALSGKCFWERAWWWEMNVTASIEKIIGTYTPDLYFTVRVKDCMLACRRPMTATDVYLHSLSVVAHGSSNWRFTLPGVSCPTVWLNSSVPFSGIGDVCENPPKPKPPKVIGNTVSATTRYIPYYTIPTTLAPPRPQDPSESLPVTAVHPGVVVMRTVGVAVVVVLVVAVLVAVIVYKKRTATEDPGYITPQVLSPGRSSPQVPLWCRQQPQHQQQHQQQPQLDSDATYESKSELYLKVI